MRPRPCTKMCGPTPPPFLACCSTRRSAASRSHRPARARSIPPCRADPMQATRIIAIRHGETAWNVDTRIQGHLDIPLNDMGLWQARQVARALAGEPLSAIYASDLQRAHTTARAIAEATGAPLVPEPALRERSFGELEGRTFAEIEAELPEQARRWRQRDPHFAPEGGETLVQLRERIAATTHRLAAQHTGGATRDESTA